MSNYPQAKYSGEDYVVSGALVECSMAKVKADGTKPTIAFHANDRQLTIREGVVGTEADTSPETNFCGNFGICKHTSKICDMRPVSLWFTEGKTIKYADNTGYLKKLKAYENAYADAIKHMDEYIKSCDDDFNSKGFLEGFGGEKSQYQKELVKQRDLMNKLKTDIMQGRDGFSNYYKENLSNFNFIQTENFEEAKNILTQMQQVVHLYYAHRPNKAKNKEYNKAVVAIDEALKFFDVLNDAQNIDKQDVILGSSVLVCRTGAGVIRFINNGQKEEAEKIKNLEVQVIERAIPFSSQCMERRHKVTGKWEADRIVYHYSAARTTDFSGFQSGLNQLYKNISAHFYITRSGRAIQLVDLSLAAYTQGPYLKDKAAHAIAKQRYLDGQEKRNLAIQAGTYTPPVNLKEEFDPANPNFYCYSIECESTAEEAGNINDAQICALINVTHFFAKHAFENNVRIPFDRIKSDALKDNVIEKYYDQGYDVTYDVVTPQWVDGHILGHSDLNATACPGANWPWKKIMTKLKEKKEINFIIWSRTFDDILKTDPINYDEILNGNYYDKDNLNLEYYNSEEQ